MFQIRPDSAGRTILVQACRFDDANREPSQTEKMQPRLRGYLSSAENSFITCQYPVRELSRVNTRDRNITRSSALWSANAGTSNRAINKFSSVCQRALYLVKLFGIIHFVRALPELSTAECPLYDEYGDNLA